MDLLGPFPTSLPGKKWIVVATDYLTRYAWNRLLAPRNGGWSCKVLHKQHIVLRHGTQTVIITDRGTAFTTKLIQCLMRMTHAHHRKTTAYHPQCNGPTERLDRILADVISTYFDVEYKMLDEILPCVSFAYTRETTRATPFQLAYGCALTTTLDGMLLRGDDDYLPGVDEFLQRAKEACQLARYWICQQQQIDASHYNRRHCEARCEPGHKVWTWTPAPRHGPSEKLFLYFGPYEVVRRLIDFTYEVR